MGPDGFALHQFVWLSDECLGVLARLIAASEAAGILPPQLDFVAMSFIPKQRGGYRTIGIFPAVLRLWTKSRRSLCSAWEEKNARAFFGAAAGKQVLDPVWRWAAQAEGQTETGVQVAAALVDVSAFFESLDHNVLMEEAAALGFPKTLVRLAIATYSAPRFVRFGP